KNYPFDNETIHQFENNIYKYWCWIKDAYLEIGTVVFRIFDICVNVASIERLWNMAKLRTDIIYNKRFYKESIVSNIINSTLETEIYDNDLETEIQDNDLETEIQEVNSETEIQNIDNIDHDSEIELLIEENEEVSNNSEDDENNNIDIEDIFQKFTDHLSKWMGILETERENSEFLKNE
ncbi:3247_t:CDS:2, partial [Diversispora eburnea]